MAEILVSGYYGFHNAGDEAILAGIIRAVRELEPEATFTVVSGTAAETRQLHGVSAISRGNFKKIWPAIGKADLFISGGGTLLQDITSSKSLSYYLGLITMAKMRFKPVMIYAQGAGPVRRPLGRTLVPLVVNGVDMITVRDPEAAETMRHLGVLHPPLHVTADPALALGPSDPDWGGKLLQEAGADLGRPIIGVSLRQWKQWEHPPEPELARALDQLAGETGAQVVFLPLQRGSDVDAAAVVARLMREQAVVAPGPFTYDQIMAMIARCDLLVGLRYHALVFAAMNAVPLVGISYDPKNDSFLKLIGESAAGSTRRIEAGALVAAARQALSDAPAVKQRLRERMAELVPLARRNAELAVQLLRNRR